MIEKIDQAPDKADSYHELVQEIISYLNNKDQSIKDRLLTERHIRKYQDTNSGDWLLNLILSLDKNRWQQTKEKQ